jgi:hypothetical protein
MSGRSTEAVFVEGGGADARAAFGELASRCAIASGGSSGQARFIRA